MRRIVNGPEMKALDRYTIDRMGVPSCVLMERAALAVVDEMERHFADTKQNERILCVCGGGNNGGDGVAIARILHLHGYAAEIYMMGNPDHRTEETRRQLEIAGNYQVPLVNNLELKEYTTIVDAIFGVGLDRAVEGRYRDVLSAMNQASAWKVAVDLPSGVSSSTGEELGIAFHADLTVTFAFGKTGLCLYPGKLFAGRVVTADVGIYENPELLPEKCVLEKKDLRKIPKRIANGNKGTFGKVLVVAGSKGMCGAAYLCAEGAFAAGAGMVKILTDEENRIPLQTLLPEAMFADDSGGEDTWADAAHWCDVIVIGPGLGQSEKSAQKTEAFLSFAQKMGKPVILDADGLNLLSKNPKWKKYFYGSQVICTPHLGEMSRLSEEFMSRKPESSRPLSEKQASRLSIPEIQKDLIGTAAKFAMQNGVVCVLKDASTVITGPEEDFCWINQSGNPGMATAGSGDVLSGILSGVLCAFLSEHDGRVKLAEMAALGVFLHGLAGDRAAQDKGTYGMKAGDIAKAAAKVLRERENMLEYI